jgi:hypothetical protein
VKDCRFVLLGVYVSPAGISLAVIYLVVHGKWLLRSLKPWLAREFVGVLILFCLVATFLCSGSHRTIERRRSA